MKTLSLIFLFAATGILGLCGCASYHQNSARVIPWEPAAASEASASVKLLRITAEVDGSGRMVFTPRRAHYEHKFWGPPTQVTFNGEPWNNLNKAPKNWRAFSKGLDLSRAWIVKRSARDVIALEPTVRGFDLYLDDSPNGAAEYSVTIAIPRTN